MNNRFQIGEPFETTVVAVTDSTIFVDLSAKSEGVVDRAELNDENGQCKVKEGDKIKVFFTGDVHGEMRFTTKIAGDKADKSMLENAYNNGIPVEGRVEAEIKGGFEVKIGSTRAFCPYSQMGFKKKEEPSYYIGRTMSFIVTEYKNESRNVLVSNRKVGEAQYNEGIAKLATQITEGAVVEATVESFEKFGVFVDIQDFRALLPMSELSFDRVDDPASILQIGQEIKVQVIRTDWKNERVSVSLKALESNPWDTVENTVKVGQKFTGKVVRIADFGLFINVAKGIDGLLHVSELEGITASTNLKKVYKVGQEMNVVVEKIDQANKRISLKSAASVEQEETASTYMSSQSDDGETYNPFAALLKK